MKTWIVGPVQVEGLEPSLRVDSIEQALFLLDESQPDLLVSAVMVPYQPGAEISDGIALLQYVHTRFPDIEKWLATEHDVDINDAKLSGTGVSKIVKIIA
jgi:CheY-like chemotaxis protein